MSSTILSILLSLIFHLLRGCAPRPRIGSSWGGAPLFPLFIVIIAISMAFPDILCRFPDWFCHYIFYVFDDFIPVRFTHIYLLFLWGVVHQGSPLTPPGWVPPFSVQSFLCFIAVTTAITISIIATITSHTSVLLSFFLAIIKTKLKR